MSRYLLLDLETAPLPNAPEFLDPVTAAKNLVDPVKIKADIEKRKADQIADCGLDWNLNRIVCAGLWDDADGETPSILTASDEDRERELLEAIACRLRHPDALSRPLILGFCVRRFDVPVLLQRARYLGVRFPYISMKKYDNPHITDLYDLLTFDELSCTSVMRRTLSAFCRRFGINVPDDVQGKDIAALLAANDWDGIRNHCIADMHKTRQLAERIGVLEPLPVPQEAL